MAFGLAEKALRRQALVNFGFWLAERIYIIYYIGIPYNYHYIIVIKAENYFLSFSSHTPGGGGGWGRRPPDTEDPPPPN